MGGIILVASIIVWALGYFPHNEELDTQAQQEQSYMGKLAHYGAYLHPTGVRLETGCGLGFRCGCQGDCSLNNGRALQQQRQFLDDQDYNDEDGKYEVLKKQMTSDLKKTYGDSDAEAAAKATLTAYSFLLFVLLYFPCIATIAAIKGETGSWKWAGFAAGYTTLLAWVVSALVFQIGSLFI